MNKKTITPGRRMIASAKKALEWVEGKGSGSVVHIPAEIDVARIRKNVGLSQSEFAEQYGFSFRTVQQWEQGRAIPTGATRAYLLVIDHEPEAVRRALVNQDKSHTGFAPLGI
ncbi:MAG TPA: helix-turn-helix domain-containing protein [Nitrospira sp.]|nr:helix-turn-helix domain-containing protein [Nitrospira sp.]